MSCAQTFLEGTAGPYHDIVDYILGITHEIWESRQVERIRDYYAADTVIYTLGGIVRGADAIIANTYETLRAFPDRLLLGDAVIWSREAPGVFYSSHRISSPMTNRAASPFGPATGKSVWVATIADCLVEQGVITREWLVRDNYTLVTQLGFDPLEVARRSVSAPLSPDFAQWLRLESARLAALPRPGAPTAVSFTDADPGTFSAAVLANVWVHGDAQSYERQYAPYAVLHDSRPVASGRTRVAGYHGAQRRALSDVSLSVDHLCVRPLDDDRREIAVRWMLRGVHRAPWLGVEATGAPILLLGVTHWRIVAGRIAAEWTVFDRLAVLAQMLRPGR